MNQIKKPNEILRIGLDFDGVVTANPFNIVRAPIKYFKSAILGKKRLSFFVPKKWWQIWLWKLVHESSVFPAKGIGRLRQLANHRDIEFYLITARFGCLETNLLRWLDRNHLRQIFKSINLNQAEEQPHLFKRRIIEKLNLDVYIEDNYDIVEYLNQETKIKIGWISNLIDRRKVYKYKYPNLDEALREMVK